MLNTPPTIEAVKQPLNKISKLVVLGDSLSDRGTLAKRKLFGFIPMAKLSGLQGHAPRGRFTNGFIWSDYFVSTLIAERKRSRYQADHSGLSRASANADLSDVIIASGASYKDEWGLNDDKKITIRGKRLARFYCEGGLTAATYTTRLTLNPVQQGARVVVATLEEKRDDLLNDDKNLNITPNEKKATLVVEWSGANDLITVNAITENEEENQGHVDRAITARIMNIDALMTDGYRHFVLINLPDLSTTPRFEKESDEIKEQAKKITNYFNQQLEQRVQAFAKDHPLSYIDIFDAHGLLKQVEANPEKHGFNAQDKTKFFLDSTAFQSDKANPDDRAEQISPATGFESWDGLHPTADLHALLGSEFEKKYMSLFSPRLLSPVAEPINASKMDISALDLPLMPISKATEAASSSVSASFLLKILCSAIVVLSLALIALAIKGGGTTAIVGVGVGVAGAFFWGRPTTKKNDRPTNDLESLPMTPS